jgi:hypothetical protein
VHEWDRFQSEWSRAGYPAAKEACEKAAEARHAIGEQIASMSAETLPGLLVRAKIIERIYDGDLSGEGEDHDSMNLKLVWATVRDLAKMSASA